MTIKGSIHWEEGLFLQQHHLQLFQRRGLEGRVEERQLNRPFPYGVIEVELSPDELRNMVVRFTTLRVVMPSGLIVDHPGNAEIPPLDISKQFQGSSAPLQLNLAVPVWYPTRGNTIPFGPDADWREKRLYRVSEVERFDENTGESPEMVRVRQINARLMIEGDDATDMEVLPILRVVHGAGEDVGLPREDPQFVPPTFLLQGSRRLTSMARDLVNAIQASRRTLLSQMTRGGFSVDTMRGVQFEQMLRLRTLSGFGRRLEHVVNAGVLSPFELYLELCELLGEMAALRPDNDQYVIQDYDHDQPLIGFADVIERIRSLLAGSVAANFVKVDFVRSGPLFEAGLTEDHFTKVREYFLAIRTSKDATELARLVTDQDVFKLMPSSQAGRAVRGVKLVEERHPPMQLPVDASVQFFRLSTAESERSWNRVRADMKLTAQWPDSEVSDMTLTLYMPVSDDGGAS